MFLPADERRNLLAEKGLKFPTIGIGRPSSLKTKFPGSTLQRGVLRPISSTLSDLLFLTVAFLVARQLSGMWSSFHGQGLQPTPGHLSSPIVFIGLAVIFLAVSRAFDSIKESSLARQLVRTLGVVSFASIVSELLGLVAVPVWYDPALGVLIWINAIFFLSVGGVITQQGLHTLTRRNVGSTRVLILDGTESVYSYAGNPGQHGPQNGSNGSGEVTRVGNGSSTAAPASRELENLTLEGDLADLPRVLDGESPGKVFLTLPADRYNQVQSVVDTHRPNGVTVHMVLYPPVNSHSSGAASSGFPMKAIPFSWQYENAKRVFDILAASLALVLWAPAMALIAISIKLDSPGPILYRQTRVGRQGRLFKMYKFRSMRQDADALQEDLMQSNEASGPMFKVRGDPRITEVGKIIRRLSMDELPQLFNVLGGTMSLVGPRPPLPGEVAEYEPWHYRRLEAVPGITGLWQVSRDGVSAFDQMVQLDMEYLDNW